MTIKNTVSEKEISNAALSNMLIADLTQEGLDELNKRLKKRGLKIIPYTVDDYSLVFEPVNDVPQSSGLFINPELSMEEISQSIIQYFGKGITMHGLLVLLMKDSGFDLIMKKQELKEREDIHAFRMPADIAKHFIKTYGPLIRESSLIDYVQLSYPEEGKLTVEIASNKI